MRLDPVTANRRRRIYFAKIGRYLKVGCSIQPEKRVATIRSTHRPHDLDLFAPTELLRHVPGAFDREAEVHVALADYHVCGEWFLADPAVLAYVDQFDPTARAPHLVRPDGPLRDELLTARRVEVAALRATLASASPTTSRPIPAGA